MTGVQKIDGVKVLPGANNQLLNPFIILEGLNVGEGSVVADLGCGGVGYFAFAAADLVGDDGIVYAVDILKPNLEAIQAKARRNNIYNIRTVWSNLEVNGATKISPNSLDVALLINILFQSKKHHDVIKEANRLLKKRGVLAIIDWKSNVAAPFGHLNTNRSDKDKIIKLAMMSGFRLESEFEAGKYHYGIKFIKL